MFSSALQLGTSTYQKKVMHRTSCPAKSVFVDRQEAASAAQMSHCLCGFVSIKAKVKVQEK
jgi:hypothetical protein